LASIKKNFAYQGAYQILLIILPFITSPYISRVLGPENTGIFSYSYSVADYFVLFAMLGINNYGNRVIATVRNDRDRLNREFSNIFALHFLLSFLVLAAYYLYVLIFPVKYKSYAMIQSLYILGAMFDINWFFFGIEEFRVTFTRNMIVKVLTVASIFAFVHDKSDLWIYITIMAGGNFISQSMVWLVLRKYVSFVKPRWKELIVHLRPLVILFVPVVAVSLYRVLDKILLWNFSNETQVGFFEYAERVINIPMGLITAFGTVMLPRMSNISAKGDTEQTMQYISTSMFFVMFMAYALSFGLASISKDFAPIFLGKAYEPCGRLIACLAATIPFIAFANVIRTQYLIPQCKDNIYILSVGLGAFVNIVTNLVLIPRFQAFGASIGSLLAEITVCVVQALAVRRELPILQYLKSGLFFLVSGAVMLGAVYFVQSLIPTSITGLLTQIATGAVVYLALSFLYVKFTKNQILISALKKLVSKNSE